jgi:hypothetical protein
MRALLGSCGDAEIGNAVADVIGIEKLEDIRQDRIGAKLKLPLPKTSGPMSAVQGRSLQHCVTALYFVLHELYS